MMGGIVIPAIIMIPVKIKKIESRIMPIFLVIVIDCSSDKAVVIWCMS